MSELNYYAFCIGMLMKEEFEKKHIEETDFMFNICEKIAREFIPIKENNQSEFSDFEILKKWIKKHKSEIEDKYLNNYEEEKYIKLKFGREIKYMGYVGIVGNFNHNHIGYTKVKIYKEDNRDECIDMTELENYDIDKSFCRYINQEYKPLQNIKELYTKDELIKSNGIDVDKVIKEAKHIAVISSENEVDGYCYDDFEVWCVIENQKNPEKSEVLLYLSEQEQLVRVSVIEKKIIVVPEWAYSTDQDIFSPLENNGKIVYMSSDAHWSTLNDILEYPEDIDHKKGMKKYIKYCKENNIDTEEELAKEAIEMLEKEEKTKKKSKER